MRKVLQIPQTPHMRIARYYSSPDTPEESYQLYLVVMLRLRTDRWRLIIRENGEYHFSCDYGTPRTTFPFWDSRTRNSALLRFLVGKLRSEQMLQSAIRRDQMNDQYYNDRNPDLMFGTATSRITNQNMQQTGEMNYA